MMGGETPQQNPGYGLTQSVDTSDGGKVYTYYDSDGNPVTDPDRLKAYSKYGGTTPYKPITGLTAAINPAAANYVAQQNNAGFQSDVERGIQRHLIAENLKTIPTNLWADSKLPISANTTLNAGGTSSPSLEAAQQAIALMQNHVPQERALAAGAGAQAELENSLNRTQEEQAAGKRFPIVSQYLDTEAGNRLFESQAEKRRLPLKDILANNQLGAASSSALVSNRLADNRLNYLNELGTTDRNRILAEQYQSGILPPSASPFGTLITPQGTFKPGAVDPNFVSPFRMKMAGFNNEAPTVGDTIGKGPTGRIALPVSNRTEFGSDRQPINNRVGALPSTGVPVSASAPKGTNINNISIGTHLTTKPAYNSSKSLSYSNQPGTDDEMKSAFVKGKRDEMIKRMKNGTGLTKDEVKSLTPEELRSLMAEAYNH